MNKSDRQRIENLRNRLDDLRAEVEQIGEELRDMARFIASVSPDIPWHVTAFHQDYRMTDPDDTPAHTLVRAVELGKSAGLNFVYAGNLPGSVAGLENTVCPGCGELLIERRGFRVKQMRIQNGCCPKCARVIPGVFA